MIGLLEKVEEVGDEDDMFMDFMGSREIEVSAIIVMMRGLFGSV